MARRTFKVIEGGKRRGAPLDGRVSLDPKAIDPRLAVAFFNHMAQPWRPTAPPALRVVRDR